MPAHALWLWSGEPKLGSARVPLRTGFSFRFLFVCKKKSFQGKFPRAKHKTRNAEKGKPQGSPQDGVFCFRFLSANEKRSKKRLQNFKREALTTKKKNSQTQSSKRETSKLKAKPCRMQGFACTVLLAGLCLQGFVGFCLQGFACKVLLAVFFFFCFRFLSVHAKLSKEKLQKKNSLKRNSEGKTSNAKIARGKLWTRETSQLEAKPCQNLESEKEKTF